MSIPTATPTTTPTATLVVTTYEEEFGDIIRQLVNCTDDFISARDNIVECVNDVQDIDNPKNLRKIREKFNEMKLFELKISEINKLVEHKLNELYENKLIELHEHSKNKYLEDKHTLVKLQLEREKLEIKRLENVSVSNVTPVTPQVVLNTPVPQFTPVVPFVPQIIPQPVYQYFRAICDPYGLVKNYYHCEEDNFSMKCQTIKCYKHNEFTLIIKYKNRDNIYDMDMDTLTVLPDKKLLFSNTISNGTQYLYHKCYVNSDA